MAKEVAIKFAIVHLEGIAHEWWHHAMATLGHDRITSYANFTKRLIDYLDRKVMELKFKELGQLKQTRIVESYNTKLQRLSVLVRYILERRIVVLFMDGLTEPFKGLVKVFNLVMLMAAIKKARDMARSTSSSKNYSHVKLPIGPKEKDNKPPPKKKSIDEAMRQYLWRRKLCFNCKKLWEPRHRCLGKGKIHYIELMSNNGEDEK